MPGSPTPASAWKRPTVVADSPLGFVVDLPSGNSAKVRRSPNFFTMVKENRLPNPLGDIVNKMIANKGEGKDINEEVTVDEQAIKVMIDFIERLLVDCMLEPRFVIPPVNEDGSPVEDWTMPEDAVGPNDLMDEDKFFLFSVVLGGTTDLEQFRKNSLALVATPPNEQTVQPKTISLPRSGRPLPGVVSR